MFRARFIRASFKGKIILPAVLIVATLTVVLTTYVSVRFLAYSDTLINEKVAANAQSLRDFVRNSQKDSKAAAISLTLNPEVINAIKARDREKILEIFTPAHELYQINYSTATDDHGIVLARAHEPETFGDSLARQQNVHEALEGHIFTHLETGTVIKVSARTGAPVFDTDGKLIGTVSAGVRYDTNEGVDLLKEHLHSEVAVFFGNTKISTTITDEKGERITGTQMDPHIAEIVINNKQEYHGDTEIHGVTYKTFFLPLVDAKGDVFAVIFTGTPMSELQSQSREMIRDIVIISLTGLAVSIVILYWAISAISKPLIELSKAMNRMEGGELSVVIDSGNNDEIGHAGKSLQKVASILHKLIDDVNATITEHEKGNTEHQLDVSGFQGAYQLLAERVAKLSCIGMEDQLTGLPNRRCFNNRLKIEWSRAVREKLFLSILMLDVDKFKNYNDTYGHQQGDLALQNTAKTLLLPIKRGYDFAARWGGEEFVILLQNTDLDGAAQVAEKIRTSIERVDIPGVAGGQRSKVTVSIGVHAAIPSTEDTIENFIGRADEALYQAKATGRNRVCQYEGPQATK